MATTYPYHERKEVITICRDPGSNRGPLDLQSNALPTELSRPRAYIAKFVYIHINNYLVLLLHCMEYNVVKSN